MTGFSVIVAEVGTDAEWSCNMCYPAMQYGDE